MSSIRRVETFAVTLSACFFPSLAPADPPITALASFEVFADGFQDLRGLAVDSASHLFVADREAGTVTRVAPDRRRTVVARGLQRPVGLAFDPTGLLLIAEEQAGRVVRVEANGKRTTIISHVKQPRWLAARTDGTLFVSARRLTRDSDAPDDESAEPEMILMRAPAGQLTIFVDGFRHLQGLVVNHATLFAATQGRWGDRRVDGVVVQIPILAHGGAGPARVFGPADEFKKPVGLVRDRLGALYVTTRALDLDEDPPRRAVGKLRPNAHLTVFAAHLTRPQGLAFDPSGNLYVADGRRVLRFLAPHAPAVATPPLTRHSPVSVTGTTVPKAEVDLLLNEATTPVTVTSNRTGVFSAPLALTLNRANTLEVFATDHSGDGLTSPPAEATIVHDNVPPALAFQGPPAGSYVRLNVNVQAQAGDSGSGVAALALVADGQSLTATVTPNLPAASATATATWLTTAVLDGTHALGATTTDRAGNTSNATGVVIVDNTPPTVLITGGPSATVQVMTAMFTFTGADNLTPVPSLQFAWRLDGGAWSAFAMDTVATLTGLAPGSHLFEVTARDLAGNESAAAQQGFTVSSLQITIMSPANGATVPAGSLLVQGAVTAGGVEVGATVNGILAAVQNGVFVAVVPVAPGPVVLTAVGTTSGGGSADHSVTVTVTGTGPGPELLALPQNGLAPLTVSFTLNGGSGAIIALDADGDGTSDFTGPALDGQAFTYARSGLYVPVATITDSQGNQVIARTVVQVHDRAALDAFFEAKWSAMKGALIRNDIEGAVAQFVAVQQDRYRTLFTALSGDIAQIAQDMQDIELIYAIEGRAKYRLPRTQAWGGQRVTLTYYVYFVQDGAGLWSIESF